MTHDKFVGVSQSGHIEIKLNFWGNPYTRNLVVPEYKHKHDPCNLIMKGFVTNYVAVLDVKKISNLLHIYFMKHIMLLSVGCCNKP